MRKTGLVVLMLLFITVGVTDTFAHMVWLTPSSFFPKAGEKVNVTMGWGHKYPADELIKETSIDSVFVLGPEGIKVTLHKDTVATYSFTPKTEGQYAVCVKVKRIYFSKTTDGRKMGSKKDLKDVVECTYYGMHAETFITVGSGTKKAQVSSALPLVIIPPENLANIKAGGEMKVKIEYQGKAAKNASCVIINEETVKKGEDQHALKGSPCDSLGVFTVKLETKGHLLVRVTQDVPYADASVCDKDSYQTTATFMVK